MLHQPSEKRSSVSKTIFVEGRQHSLNDVVVLLAKIMVIGQFWIKVTGDDNPMFPYVLRQLIELANVLTSAKFREFSATMKGVCSYLAHTLIINIFNVFNRCVEFAKNPHVIRELKATGQINIKHVKVPTLIIRQLLEQLQLCDETSSPGILCAHPPCSFVISCAALARSGVNFFPPSSPSPWSGV